MVRPLSEERLLALVHDLRTEPIEFTGVVYRSVIPKYIQSDEILSGTGGARYGGRWNPIGLHAVYACLSPETAMAETLAHVRYYGLPEHKALPRLFVAIELRLRHLLDLTQARHRRRLAISERAILELDWRKELDEGRVPLTQRIGLAGSRAGFEGLLTKLTQQPEGKNIVIFPGNLHRGSQMRVCE